MTTRIPKASQGVTLAEVVVAMGILAILLLGVLAILTQSRRTTDESIYQGTATTIATGYMEQLRSMDLAFLCNYDTNGNAQLTASYSIPTLYPQPDVNSEATPDPLSTTPGTPPALSSITPGTTPNGLVDNLKSFDMAKSIGAANVGVQDTSNTSTAGGTTSTATVVTARSTWPALWPNARNYPTASTGSTTGGAVNPTPTTTTPGVTDLHLNLWVWVRDLTGATPKAQKVYGITLYYTWQYRDGAKVRYAMNTLHAIRSSVPTF